MTPPTTLAFPTPGTPPVSEGRSGADPTAAPKHYWLTCLGSGPCLGALRYVCFVGLTDRGQFCFLVWFWSVRELASARDCARWVPLPPVRVCPRTPSKLLEPGGRADGDGCSLRLRRRVFGGWRTHGKPHRFAVRLGEHGSAPPSCGCSQSDSTADAGGVGGAWKGCVAPFLLLRPEGLCQYCTP